MGMTVTCSLITALLAGLGTYAIAGVTDAGKLRVEVAADKDDLKTHKTDCNERWKQVESRLANIERLLMERR